MNKLGFLENYGEELIIQKMTGISVMNTFHIHPQYEIYFCPKDIKQKSVINGIEYEYKHPAVILSKPYSIHSMSCMETSNTDFERYVIYFSPTNESFLNTNNLPDIIIGEKAGLLFKLTEAEANSLKNIFSFFLTGADHNISKRESELLILFFINRLFTICGEDRILKIGGTEFYIQDVLRYISENFQSNISVADILQKFPVSRSKLERDFREATGKTPHSFIDMCKINQAKKLLTSKNNYSISKIANLCGFSSETYFFPFFQKHTGVLPSEYRKTILKKSNNKSQVNQIN